MHHFALILAIGVPFQPGGSRCCCLSTNTAPAPITAVAAPATPISVLTTSPAPRSAIVPKYGALTTHPPATPSAQSFLTGDRVEIVPEYPAPSLGVPAGIWRAAASMFRLTVRPNTAPMGGLLHR